MKPTSQKRDNISFSLRPGRADERRIRYRLVEQTWREAYRHIYYTNEIDGVFDGRLPSYGDWVERRKETIGHIVAESDGKVVGLVSLGLLKSGEGEVTALYVLPEYQGYGVGQALWDEGCKQLHELGCPAVWVWTVARAAAVKFYERQGCVRADTGTYTVGEHVEKAVGFRLAWVEKT